MPIINEYELEQVLACLAIINPGRSSESHIRSLVNQEWPFNSLATGGWVAYCSHENNVRVALTPYTVELYLNQ